MDREKNKNKTNYSVICEQMIKDHCSGEQKPRLLLHVCCAPCSSSVVEYLSKHFRIELYYYNPNIHPESEYRRRYGEFEKLIDRAEFFDSRFRFRVSHVISCLLLVSGCPVAGVSAKEGGLSSLTRGNVSSGCTCPFKQKKITVGSASG